MVARRSASGNVPSRGRATNRQSSSYSSGGSARYSSRHKDPSIESSRAAASRRPRTSGRTRPSTRRPYRDTFYEDMLTDGIFDLPTKEDELEAEEGYASLNDPYDKAYEEDVSIIEEPYANLNASVYARDRYGNHAASRRGHMEQDPEGDVYQANRAHGAHSRESTQRYSSTYAADRYRQPSRKRGGFSRRNKILVAVAVIVVLIGGGLFAYLNGITNNLQRGIDSNLRNALVQTDMANEPFFVLLLGTDGSLEREASGDFGTYRSDSIMLVRIDPVNKKVALVSLSRDILVDLGEYGEQKINAAYGLGGPALTVKAVSELTGVPISHYAQVDFDGFSDLVDALGGVTVNVPVDIDDDDAGGKLSAGEQVLNGKQALILCRSRYTYADLAAQPDAMRAANQRLVLSAIAHKLLDADIATIAGSVQALSEFVTTDLSLTDIIGIAQIMSGLDSTTDIYTAQAPTTSRYVEGISVDTINTEAWNKMMRRLKEGLTPTEEAQVDELTGTVLATVGTDIDISAGDKHATVTVKNGTEIQGVANQVRNALLSYGFQNVVIGDVNAAYEYPHTLVIYNKDNAAYGAEQLVKIIGQGEVVKNNGDYYMPDSDYLIVIGEDWV